MKSEPHAYAISDLARDTRTAWEGVRNYQARNFIRDTMRVGDTVFFYHSSCALPAIVGVARVCSAPYPDPLATGECDARGMPRWYACDICYVRTLKEPITLHAMRSDSHLQSLTLLRKGNRLSVLPLTHDEGAYLATFR